MERRKRGMLERQKTERSGETESEKQGNERERERARGEQVSRGRNE
jgi:hypothetical protein